MNLVGSELVIDNTLAVQVYFDQVGNQYCQLMFALV